MLKVFEEKRAENLRVELSDGRIMPLEDLVRDYERLLNEESLKKEATSKPKDDTQAASEPKDDGQAASKLKVGEWFRIDRDVINKSKEEIRLKCNEAGDEGKAYWKRFEASNKIADENPDQYPRLIETYIFEHRWNYKILQEMQNMCERVGEGMCDEIICDLELQMRICNGESAIDLFKKADKLPRARVVKFRDGSNGYFGGGADFNHNFSPADLYRNHFDPNFVNNYDTPYAFRRVFPKD